MNEMQNREISDIDDLNDLSAEDELITEAPMPSEEYLMEDGSVTIPQPIDAPMAANAPMNGAMEMDMSASDLNVAPIPGEDFTASYQPTPTLPAPIPDNAMSADVPEPVSMTDLKASATQAMSQAKDSAAQAMSQAKETAGQAFVQAKTQIASQVRSQMEEKKGKAAESLNNLHGTVGDFSQTFRQNNMPQLAEYTDNLNGQIDKAADYLKNTDTDTMVQDASKFARDNAPIFLAGAFILGIAVGRFLRSSNKGVAYTDERNALVPINASNLNTNGTVRDIAKGSDAQLPGRQDVANDSFGAKPLHAADYVPGGILGGAPA